MLPHGAGKAGRVMLPPGGPPAPPDAPAPPTSSGQPASPPARIAPIATPASPPMVGSPAPPASATDPEPELLAPPLLPAAPLVSHLPCSTQSRTVMSDKQAIGASPSVSSAIAS